MSKSLCCDNLTIMFISHTAMNPQDHHTNESLRAQVAALQLEVSQLRLWCNPINRGPYAGPDLTNMGPSVSSEHSPEGVMWRHHVVQKIADIENELDKLRDTVRNLCRAQPLLNDGKAKPASNVASGDTRTDS
jgi:phage host-nuclease inhibitor protein Gam